MAKWLGDLVTTWFGGVVSWVDSVAFGRRGVDRCVENGFKEQSKMASTINVKVDPKRVHIH